MANHNQLGKTGEQLASEYLVTKGYIIRDVNWKSGRYELDIVAYSGKTLVIVEVKTRRNEDFAYPEEAVDERKINNIVKAAEAYIHMYDIPFETRFDIITLVGTGDNFHLEHIIDAFYPPLTRYH